MPAWNQSPGGSPPALDDILEKIRLNLKGFKGSPVLILVAVVVVVTVLWTAWFTVQPEETGIVQRFGKVMRTAGPGLHFKLPFGVEKVRLLPTARVLKEEFGFRTVATVPGEKTRYDPSGSSPRTATSINTSRRRSRARRRTWRLRFHKALHHRQETLCVKAV
jgi:membrane protease subunit HflK